MSGCYLLSPQFLYTPFTNSIMEAMPVLKRISSVSVVTYRLQSGNGRTFSKGCQVVS